MVKLTPPKKKDMVKYADDGDVRKKKKEGECVEDSNRTVRIETFFLTIEFSFLGQLPKPNSVSP